jgi:hypothetical protein
VAVLTALLGAVPLNNTNNTATIYGVAVLLLLSRGSEPVSRGRPEPEAVAAAAEWQPSAAAAGAAARSIPLRAALLESRVQPARHCANA